MSYRLRISEISAAVYCSTQPLPEKNPLATINLFISGEQGNLLASFVLISKNYILYTLDLKRQLAGQPLQTPRQLDSYEERESRSEKWSVALLASSLASCVTFSTDEFL